VSTVLDIRKAPGTATFLADYVGEFLGQLALRRLEATGGFLSGDLQEKIYEEELAIMTWWLSLPVVGSLKWKYHPSVNRSFILQFPPLPVFCSDKIQPGTGTPGEHYAGYLAFLSMSLQQGNPRVTLHDATVRKRIR